VAHGAALRILAKNPHIADQITANWRQADVTPRQRAMLDLAVKITVDSAGIDEEDFERLRGHGFTNRDIWDIGAIAGFFNFSNRMANLAALRPNPEFYTMGRAQPGAPSD
jgi:uncharacterized peroxidase-related enzyme